MENPEEVLQALDEFQKLRPADIPKELEEYLSWVAKTGDPVYQWPVVKALFREKLLRVMTEFYESCPTLELAPCPNVEQFNYDIMKSTLLDRLESFANAPFTVQRICELLTAPRKEYNRVDKFMRAIEKNILVVSTREPGPTARRSENGDGMVNGSSEDNGSRSPYDMDLWTRACTLATTVTVQTVETHSTIVNIHNLPTNIIPATELTLVKNNSAASVEAFTPYGAESDICDTEMTSKSQELPSTFTPSTSEIASIANLTSQIQPQDLNSTSGIQNLSNIVSEPSNIVGDVPEAIMNEDTNSQPSLDLENNDTESFETNKKLQTTFQSSDFISRGIKSQKFYSDDSNKIEKTIVEAESLRNDIDPLIELEQKDDNSEIDKINTEPKSSNENGEPILSATVITADSIEMSDNIEEKTSDLEQSALSKQAIEESNEDIHRNKTGEDETQATESVVLDSEDTTLLKNGTDSALLDISTEKDDDSCAKLDTGTQEEATESKSVSATSKSAISCTTDNSTSITQGVTITEGNSLATSESKDLKALTEDDDKVADEIRPVDEADRETDKIEENKESFEEKSKKVSNLEAKQVSITIEEVSNTDENKVIKSIVPDPLPIVEEPKDEETATDLNKKETIVDVTNEEKSKPIDTVLVLEESAKASIDTIAEQDVLKLNAELSNVESTSESFSIEDTPSMVCSSGEIQDIVPAESMEIDVAEGSQTCQQDEPMEEEVSDLDKS